MSDKNKRVIIISDKKSSQTEEAKKEKQVIKIGRPPKEPKQKVAEVQNVSREEVETEVSPSVKVKKVEQKVEQKESLADVSPTIQNEYENVVYEVKSKMHSREFDLRDWYQKEISHKSVNGEPIVDEFRMFSGYLDHLSEQEYLNSTKTFEKRVE